MDFALPIEFEDQQIIQACARKERWAQKRLYEEFYGKMMGVCLRFSNNSDDALDILHEGFIKVFKNIHKFTVGTSLSAWMRRIMVNTAIDFYRKNARRRTEDLDQAVEIAENGADAISKISRKEILKAVKQLSPVYRTVFNLYAIEGYSHKEIGELLDITESTSRSNLVKARAKLKEILSVIYTEYEQ